MNTSLNIKMKDTGGKDLQKSITYVSASASSADLVSMAQGLVGLTTNTYESADRIQKMNVDTESYVVPKQVPTLSVTDDGGGKLGTITYTGDGSLATAGKADYTISGSMLQGGDESTAYTGVIYATETDKYYQAWAIIPQLTGGPT